jgi:hypothetical protein
MKAKFTLGCQLTNAVDLSAGAWTSARLTLKVYDNSGANIGTGIQVGDAVWLDTGSFEPGTQTEYSITALTTPGSATTVVTASRVASDNAAPDLSYCVGTTGFIARPSAAMGLLPVPAPGVQQLSDSLSIAGLNRNAAKLDTAPAIVVSATQPANPAINTIWVQIP